MPAEKRTARYYVALAYVRSENDPVPIVVTGSWEGSIATKALGSGGFGYDPLFLCTELNKTFAEATAGEKNSVSHRARALAALKRKLHA